MPEAVRLKGSQTVGVAKTGWVTTELASLIVESCGVLQAEMSMALIKTQAAAALRRVSLGESIMSGHRCNVVLLPKFSAVDAACGVYYETVKMPFLQFTHHIDFGAKVHVWQVFTMLVFEHIDQTMGLGLSNQRFVARILQGVIVKRYTKNPVSV